MIIKGTLALLALSSLSGEAGTNTARKTLNKPTPCEAPDAYYRSLPPQQPERDFYGRPMGKRTI